MTEFRSLMSSLPEVERLYAMIAYHAAPTLNRVKPSNLITFAPGPNSLIDAWRQYGAAICSRLKLSAVELSECSGSAVVFFYKEELLARTLTVPSGSAFLAENGYPENASVVDMLLRLKSRFSEGCPHEIGIFLGIPAEDVRGFIRNGGQNCSACRYWKVYHNLQHAEERFAAFDRARSRMANALFTRFSTENAGRYSNVITIRQHLGKGDTVCCIAGKQLNITPTMTSSIA